MAAPARDPGSSLEHHSLATLRLRMRARVGGSIAAVLTLELPVELPEAPAGRTARLAALDSPDREARA